MMEIKIIIKTVKRIYLIAAIYGLLVLIPQLFMENKTGIDFPPAITHPEFFYGFVGLGLVWQICFIIIAKDPVRYKPIMIITILEKLSFGLVTFCLYLMSRLNSTMFFAGLIDLFIMLLFIFSYLKTPDINSEQPKI